MLRDPTFIAHESRCNVYYPIYPVPGRLPPSEDFSKFALMSSHLSLSRSKENKPKYIYYYKWFTASQKKKNKTISKSDETPTMAKQLLCSMHALLLVNARPRSTIYKQIFVAILQTVLHFIEVNDHLRVFDIQNDGVITTNVEVVLL